MKNPLKPAGSSPIVGGFGLVSVEVVVEASIVFVCSRTGALKFVGVAASTVCTSQGVKSVVDESTIFDVACSASNASIYPGFFICAYA